jgi:hypothetical protein
MASCCMQVHRKLRAGCVALSARGRVAGGPACAACTGVPDSWSCMAFHAWSGWHRVFLQYCMHRSACFKFLWRSAPKPEWRRWRSHARRAGRNAGRATTSGSSTKRTSRASSPSTPPSSACPWVRPKPSRGRHACTFKAFACSGVCYHSRCPCFSPMACCPTRLNQV